MNKVLIYTSNLGFTPKTMSDVVNFAESHDKFRIAEVGLNDYLANVKVGDNIITKKGNSLYIIKAFDKSVDELDGADAAYVDNLVRNYDLKKVNITSVANRIKFETWCRTARPLINKETLKTQSNVNSIKNFGERLKDAFLPKKADDVRIASDGNICVATKNGYVAIDKDFNLVAYPTELTLDLPAYTISKPINQLQVGDIIAREQSYAKVKYIKDNKITVVGYTGAGSNVYPIKDFFLGESMVRVVVSLAGNIGGQINPMLLLAMSDKSDSNSLLPLLMMNQQGGALAANPMMLALLAGGDKGVDFKDLLLYSSLGGQNPFGGLFGAPAAAQAPVAPAAPVVEENKAE